ncbi:MAG: hypothetical protein WCG96_02395, partial [Actinomycetes bacterium]
MTVAARARHRLGAAIAVVIMAVVAPLSVPAGSAPAPNGLRLVSQTTTVQPGSDGSGRFQIAFTRPSGTGGVTVTTRLYAPLSTRSGFLAALSPAGPISEIAETAPLSLGCLPRTGDDGSGRRLSITVMA